jgi:hypothetical protein
VSPMAAPQLEILVEFKNIGRWRQHIDKSNA